MVVGGSSAPSLDGQRTQIPLDTLLSSSDGALDPPSQEGVDKGRQFFAIPAFEDRARGNPCLAQPSSERSEIFHFQGHLGDRITRVGIESRGDENQIGSERDESIQRALDLSKVLSPRSQGRDRKIMNVVERASSPFPDSRGTGGSTRKRFAGCRGRYLRCRSRDVHRSPRWRRAPRRFPKRPARPPRYC